jgi:hypothetical protein
MQKAPCCEILEMLAFLNATFSKDRKTYTGRMASGASFVPSVAIREVSLRDGLQGIATIVCAGQDPSQRSAGAARRR